MRQLVLDITPGEPPRLEDFVTGRNAEVILALRQWAEGREGERFIYLWGSPGSGKTHLLRALALHRYVACTADTRFKPDPHPLLLVDDVDRLSPEGAESLFHRFNERRDEDARLLATGPCPPGQLALLPDLATRLGWGLVLRVHALEDHEKITALETRAAQMGVRLAPDASRYILTHWARDTGSLFSLMQELNRWSLSTHRPMITVPLVREALAALQPQTNHS
ncbi:MAG: DnaA regulatory inactivator Hda [Betaproteobacteria bacterium]|nr:DnaA regulatory inactivator Hda [Betaproteobacteria bacterium]MDE2622278.1 DnaA regulatory inactivator Hda [Betaproteobacteria bacterium]